jgi:replicative DNA helicase
MKNEGVQVVFIDYLQRIVHNKNRDAQELEEISNIIADATREEGIAIILLSQMQNIAENEIPTIGHLKGSGGIGESADTILLLDNIARRTHKDTDKGNMDIYVEQRYGDSGKVELLCDLGTLWFGDRASDMPF